MKIKDPNLKLVIIAFVVLLVLLLSCIGCGALSYGYYRLSVRDFNQLVDTTKEIDNYTLSYDFYLRGNSEYMKEDFWIDISGSQTVDGKIWRGTLNIDSHEYESMSEFVDLGDTLIGKIDYEDPKLNKSWKEITDRGYDPYNLNFQKNENIVLDGITAYNSVLSRLVIASEKETVHNLNIFEGKYYVTFENPDPVISYFVSSLIDEAYHYVCLDSVDVDVENVWATVKVESGVITEIKIYFTDVTIKDCGDKFYIEEGGITYTLTDIDKTKVDIPFGFEED
ncbi:hypothetical protein JW962_00830 [Candidatus Dojkabacteria bacterium]|nr:hypothetical protein [Candidatus Dojkabacteria bacterium]